MREKVVDDRRPTSRLGQQKTAAAEAREHWLDHAGRTQRGQGAIECVAPGFEYVRGSPRGFRVPGSGNSNVSSQVGFLVIARTAAIGIRVKT